MIGSLSIIQRPSFVETLASIKWFHSRPYIPRAWKGATNGGTPPHRFRSTSLLYLVWQNGLTDSIRIYIRIVINHFKSIFAVTDPVQVSSFHFWNPLQLWSDSRSFPWYPCIWDRAFLQTKRKIRFPSGFKIVKLGAPLFLVFFSQAPGRFWKVFRSLRFKTQPFWGLRFTIPVQCWRSNLS